MQMFIQLSVHEMLQVVENGTLEAMYEGLDEKHDKLVMSRTLKERATPKTDDCVSKEPVSEPEEVEAEPQEGFIEVKPEEKQPFCTIEELRALMRRKTKENKKDALKEVLKSYGARTLPEVKEEDYEALYKEVEVL